jgi:hypothetical protein
MMSAGITSFGQVFKKIWPDLSSLESDIKNNLTMTSQEYIKFRERIIIAIVLN